MVRVIGWFNKMMHELVEMSYLHTTPVLMDDSAFAKLFPNLRKTPYKESIRQILLATQNNLAHK